MTPGPSSATATGFGDAVKNRARLVSMARKLGLPVVEELLASKPTLAEARRRLGGPRGGEGEDVGRIVTVAAGALRTGVVLFASNDERHVVFDGGVVRRTSVEKCMYDARDVAEPLRALADDVRVFAALADGDEVVFTDGAAEARGTIVEMCRYGALVGLRDGRVLALGFRKLRPAGAGAA